MGGSKKKEKAPPPTDDGEKAPQEGPVVRKRGAKPNAAAESRVEGSRRISTGIKHRNPRARTRSARIPKSE